MERDFLGLNSRDSVAVVKEEFKDGGKETVFMGSSAVQWPFSNKVCALPQFLPFKATQDERARKMILDPVASSAFQPMPTADAFDSNHKLAGVPPQKCFNLERHGNQLLMPGYPAQSVDVHGVSAHRIHEMRSFPVANHSLSAAMANPFFKIHGSIAGPNVSASMKQQPLGGIPVTTPHSMIPMMGSTAGTYTPTPRNATKPLGAPAQLTIFYAGTVNVYDDIPLEKAQAIMFLAGNSMTANAANTKAKVQASTPKPAAGDAVHGNQSHVTSPCSGLSSPMSVTSHPAAQSANGSSNTEDLMSAKPIATSVPNNKLETPKAVPSMSSANMMPAVPMARKASLARFLEKRKERVMNTAPYTSSKKSPESASGSDATGTSSKSPSASASPPWNLNHHKNEADSASLQTKLQM